MGFEKSGVEIEFNIWPIVFIILLAGIGFYIKSEMDRYEARQKAELAREQERDRQREAEAKERRAEQQRQREEELAQAKLASLDKVKDAERRKQQQREELVKNAELQIRKAEAERALLEQINKNKIREMLAREADELRQTLQTNEGEAAALELQLRAMEPPVRRVMREIDDGKAEFKRTAARFEELALRQPRPSNLDVLLEACRNDMEKQVKRTDALEKKLEEMNSQIGSVKILLQRAQNIITKSRARLKEIESIKD
ncbi:MAG TPA: hypothetical protein VEK08_13800 [Planctomycetota bacterium]|nr:hypothetical protein [Planctomycetota bacterium]